MGMITYSLHLSALPNKAKFKNEATEKLINARLEN